VTRLETDEIHWRTSWWMRFCQQLRRSLTEAADLILKSLPCNSRQPLTRFYYYYYYYYYYICLMALFPGQPGKPER